MTGSAPSTGRGLGVTPDAMRAAEGNCPALCNERGLGADSSPTSRCLSQRPAVADDTMGPKVWPCRV